MNQMLSNKDVAKILNEIGTLLELKGDNPFKIRAYYNGASTISRLSQDLSVLIESGELSNIKGIGSALTKKIETLVATGNLPYYEELRSSIPSGLLDILRIQGLGAKKVRKLWTDLEITALGELEYACNENRLITLEGFGLKTQEKVVEGIQFVRKYSDRFLLSTGMKEAGRVLSALKSCEWVKRAAVVGSVRRKREIIRNIDILAEADRESQSEVLHFLTDSIKSEITVLAEGNPASIKLESGMAADIHYVDESEYPFAMLYYTGSRKHNQSLGTFAMNAGFELMKTGLSREGENINCSDENDIYSVLGLQYIPPELREDTGEIMLASRHDVPVLLEEDEIRGCFHNHTRYSDGRGTISEMVQAAIDLGFQYLGISDHSRTAFYANGLSIERVKEQWQEIEQLKTDINDFTIFKSIESDILADGRLDYPDEILSGFDYVVASVHSHFKLSEAEQTERILKAIRHPSVKILGHPTGRLLLSRDSYAVDMERIIREAARSNVAVEINSNPHRLDLDWRWGNLANEVGLKVAINPDAHSLEGLGDVIYGVYMARKAGIAKDNILNTWNVERLLEFFS